ncbi:ribosome biogenesis GTPase A [Tepiditoga spiralis]|uniref:Ribosome biogenesis GTPase A n=1 Tax=Tepiditoga spiralis TaxID=2108365 RepID=A0A7G1G5L5_9BACT|nr:ribosome biogenesis GTPase YlqF [Tepiditoga spiralis]BBE31880.1 ribosome biogenesis GTPase A [Tepiditoga spiralis]
MWYPGHIAKTKRAIKDNIKAVSAVIELVDSRIPYSSRAYEYASLFRDKKKIIIFNKYDICEIEKTKKWIKIYENKGYIVKTVSLKSINIKNFLKKNIANEIPEKFNERRALVVGAPNVGKSTFINSLKGKKTTSVGNTPGITRGVQWINVDSKTKIMDTPGILFPELYNKSIAYKLILAGCLKAEDDEADDAAFFAFDYLKENNPKILENSVENGSKLENAYEFIENFAKKRNFLKKGGIGDYQRGLKTWLKEISDGKLGRITYEIPDEYEEIKV